MTGISPFASLCAKILIALHGVLIFMGLHAFGFMYHVISDVREDKERRIILRCVKSRWTKIYSHMHMFALVLNPAKINDTYGSISKLIDDKTTISVSKESLHTHCNRSGASESQVRLLS